MKKTVGFFVTGRDSGGNGIGLEFVMGESEADAKKHAALLGDDRVVTVMAYPFVLDSDLDEHELRIWPVLEALNSVGINSVCKILEMASDLAATIPDKACLSCGSPK